MKNLILVTVLLTVFSIDAFANLAYLTIEEHLAQSDLAVVGKLVSASETNWYNGRNGYGFIEIDLVLTNGSNTSEGVLLAPKDKLQIKWIENIRCVDGWHKRTENKKGIWLLKIESDGTVSAYHPGKFIDLEELNKVNKILRKSRRNENGVVSETRLRTFDGASSSSLSFAMLVFIFALILFGILYRSRIKIRIKRMKDSKS